MKKKYILVPIFILGVLFCSGISANATSNDTQDIFQEQYDKSGADDLLEKAPENGANFFDKLGIDTLTPEQLQSITPETVFSEVLDISGNVSQLPIKAGLGILGIILLCAVLNGMKSTFGESQMEGIFGMVCSLAMVGIVVSPILGTMETVGSVIEGTSVFMFSLIPVMVSVMLAGGHVAGAASYSALILGASETVQTLVNYVVRPLLSLFLGLSIASAISPRLKLSKLSAQLHTVIKWLITLAMSSFVTILTVNGLIGKAADNFGAHTTKFFISNMVPVVGGALSDAYLSIGGCLEVLKTSVGAFGIIAIGVTFLPPLISCIVWRMVLAICETVSDVLTVESVRDILKSIGSVVSMMITILLCSMLTLIISITVMLIFGGNVS